MITDTAITVVKKTAARPASLALTGCSRAGIGALMLLWVLTQSWSAAANDPAAGEVQGVVIFTGPAPQPYVAFEAGGVLRHKVELDGETRGLKDAVIHLEPLDGRKPPAPQRGLPVVIIDQVAWEFVPHIVAVREGQAVRFTNGDNGNHHVMAVSFVDANLINRFVTESQPYTHRFVTSRYPVQLSCSIHPSMWGWIYVFDHPYFALSDRVGRFRIRHVPPGRYRLVLQHQEARVRTTRDIEVPAGGKLNLHLVAWGRGSKPGRASRSSSPARR